MNKEFVDWFISVFGTEFLISTEQQRQNLIDRGEKGLDSSVGGYGSNHVLRGAWAAWQALHHWLPMEIAPKDVECIFLNGGTTEFGTWESGEEGDMPEVPALRDDDCADIGLMRCTGWMPIPARGDIRKALYKKEINPSNARDDLFELMDREHNCALVESELDSVIYCILNALEIDAVGTAFCTKVHYASGEHHA